jgi:hypothetical protein
MQRFSDAFLIVVQCQFSETGVPLGTPADFPIMPGVSWKISINEPFQSTPVPQWIQFFHLSVGGATRFLLR